MQIGFGEAGILVRFKDIVVVALYGVGGLGIQLDIHLAVLDIVERPYVVQSRHMVAVRMGDKDGVKVVHLVPQHLLTEVGSYIEQDIPSLIGRQ